MNTETVSVRPAFLAEIFKALSSNTTDDKILDFADIKSGWHFGEGATISSMAIRDAMKLHNSLIEYGFYETDAFPGLDGELRVTAYTEDEYLEFTRETDGSWSYVLEQNGEVEDEQDSLALEEVQDIITQHVGRTWNTFAFCHGNIGTNTAGDFRVLLSDRQEMGEFRSSRWNASPPSKGRFAVTSENFIHLPESHQSSVGSMIRYYQTPPVSKKLPATQATNAIGTSWELAAKNLSDYSEHILFYPASSSVMATNLKGLVFKPVDLDISCHGLPSRPSCK